MNSVPPSVLRNPAIVLTTASSIRLSLHALAQVPARGRLELDLVRLVAGDELAARDGEERLLAPQLLGDLLRERRVGSICSSTACVISSTSSLLDASPSARGERDRGRRLRSGSS